METVITPMYRYVKVVGHPNWFLVLEPGDDEPDGLSVDMQEKLFRGEVSDLHNPEARMDFVHRVVFAAIHQIDYVQLANKYGTILIRPIGSFMPLSHNEIIDECFDSNFPIDEYGEIVICENDRDCEYNWSVYLKNRFPNMKIITINFFDLRSESDVEKYFKRAKYITFSTTFSNYRWFEKLTKFATYNHTIIGYCHTPENWTRALEINPNVEVVESMKIN